MTLKEAADLEFKSLTNMDRIFLEANSRGIMAVPEGSGYRLTYNGGQSTHYDDDLDALAAITRIPVEKRGFNITAEMEREWNMGLTNAVDPETASEAFLPTNMQEVVLKQVMRGESPLVELRTSSYANLNAAVEALTEDAPTRIKMTTINEYFQDAKVAARVAVYDEDAVLGIIKSNVRPLRALGIDVDKPLDDIISQMAANPSGLRALKGTDPQSGIMQSYFVKNSMKGNVQEGQLVTDATGPHRIFSQDQKNAFNARPCT